jgi:hypothetical protein
MAEPRDARALGFREFDGGEQCRITEEHRADTKAISCSRQLVGLCS